MNWIKRFRTGESSDQGNQFLYYVRSELLGKYFAVVRVTWRDSTGVFCISETCIEKGESDVICELVEIMSVALHAGSNVCVICSEDPDYLGIHDT